MPDVDLAAARALAKLDVEDLLLPVLVQLVVVVAAARAVGAVARRVGQPAVVGEIVAGLALGPSLFGWLAPDLFAAVFRPPLPGVPDALALAALPKVFQVLAQVGLIFLLFLVGLEFDLDHLRAKGRAAAAVSLAGIAVPFALGAGLAPLVHPHLEPHPAAGPVPLFGLTLFLGTALSVTAVPVLGRVMLELGIARTGLAAVALAAAAVGDAVGWVLLSAVAALARSAYDPLETAKMAALTAGFAAAVFFAVRPALGRYLAWSMERTGGRLSLNAFAVLLVALFLCAIATNRIGIFALFGAFLLGTSLSDQEGVRRAVAERTRDFVTSFFVPVYFTYTGLRTDVGTLTGPTAWLIAGAVAAAAVVGKFAGCGLAARLTGLRWREAAVVGVMMNARGLMELVVVNVGYEAGVIPKSLFTALVLMAVLTTVTTTPGLLLLRRGTELEAPIAASGFLGGPPAADRPVPAHAVARPEGS